MIGTAGSPVTLHFSIHLRMSGSPSTRFRHLEVSDHTSARLVDLVQDEGGVASRARVEIHGVGKQRERMTKNEKDVLLKLGSLRIDPNPPDEWISLSWREKFSTRE